MKVNAQNHDAMGMLVIGAEVLSRVLYTDNREREDMNPGLRRFVISV